MSLDELQTTCSNLLLESQSSKDDTISEPYMDVLENVSYGVIDLFYNILFGELKSESYEVIGQKQERCEKVALVLFRLDKNENSNSHAQKIMTLLSNSSNESQHQALLLFESVDTQI